MTVADPNWNSVTLMVHGEDFRDTVTNTDALLVGSPTISTSQILFGSGSLRVTPTNYIRFADDDKWDFGVGDFSIEFAIYFAGSPYSRVILGQTGAGVGWQVFTDSYGVLNFRYSDGTYDRDGYGTSASLVNGQWYRVAITRTSDVLRFYLNGTQSGSTYWSYNWNVSGSTNFLTVGSSLDAYLAEIRITKGVSRVSTYTYTLDTEPFPDADHPQYKMSLSEAILALDANYAGPGTLLMDGVSETVLALESVTTRELPILSDGIVVSDAATYGRIGDLEDTILVSDSVATLAATAVSELIGCSESLSTQSQFVLTLSEIVRALDAVKSGLPVAVSESVTLAWALSAIQATRITEALKITEVVTRVFTLGASLSDSARVYDALRNFFNFDLVEDITVSEAVQNLIRHTGLLAESLTATETLSPYFLLSAEASDEAVLDDAFNIKMIFQPQVLEQIKVSALMVEPNGGVTTWAVNTRTGAVTEYANYEFNSFAQNHRHYVGASSTGLYQLDGDDDAGEPIIAQLRSGYAQFGGSRYTSFKAAYLGLRGDGSVFLKLDTGDGKTYTYKSVVQDQQSTKVRFGKGLRARYFAFELISEGQDFDLDTIEFLPVVAQRRV